MSLPNRILVAIAQKRGCKMHGGKHIVTSLPSSGKLLWVVSFSGFLTGFDYTALNIAMPTLSTEFAASYSLTSWVLLAYALIFVAGAIPASNLMRIYGLRLTMMALSLIHI